MREGSSVVERGGDEVELGVCEDRDRDRDKERDTG